MLAQHGGRGFDPTEDTESSSGMDTRTFNKMAAEASIRLRILKERKN